MPPVADATSQGQDATSQGQDTNSQGQAANPQGQAANPQGQDTNPQGQDTNPRGKKPPCSDPKVAEQMRQLSWDILALADSFGWTDKPAKDIPPSKKPVRWASPTEPARRQRELAEYLAKKN